MGEEEIVLAGGNVSRVIRIGETVRRTMGPWSSTVHHLLLHLEGNGFAAAPRFLGIDSQGREILSFIAGAVGHYPLPPAFWSDEALTKIADMLREFHAITTYYVSPQEAQWQITYADVTRHEVICHNDVAPYNMVFRNNIPVALIDFDTAGPGPRVWDLAYAAYRFVPLLHSGDDELRSTGLLEPEVQARRLKLFCTTYGSIEPMSVLLMVEERLQHLCNLIITRAEAGDQAFQKMLAEEHLVNYQREIAALPGQIKNLQPYL
ncbi:trifolitoxin immunity domain-containing protein [Dictyobacter alpinus]|uniref:Trifolitoxin immunity domain-containing protein n=1 Tax=Dictyobacter alpinus TaxID=2014873 RepID=A0A402BIF2_9CHLR|nr:aminoglycoside phosphotransferase family protein [Dictyobacter alpinus]GCE31120.1 trifolitoxin immunity domain-containing protein [Dictyobacter alpinus]